MSELLRSVSDAVDGPGEALHPALQAFCSRTKALLTQGQEVGQLLQVRDGLQQLLCNVEFVAAYCGPDAKPGLHLLYEDGDLGFQVLAHVNEKARVSPPHDHGRSWAIYGQAVGETDMTEWQHVVDDGDPPLVRMVATGKYRLRPGMAGLFPPGEIHSIDYPADTRFVRVTGVNLDGIQRRAFDPLTGKVRMMGPPAT